MLTASINWSPVAPLASSLPSSARTASTIS
jgi:hypothetical protein